MRLLALLTFLIITPKLAWSQTTFNYGPELGISISKFPSRNEYSIESRGDRITEKTLPLVSPLIGFQGQVIIKNHLQLTGSLQYQKIGERYYYHRDGNNLLYGGTYTSDEWKNQTFQKLCLPLTLGYVFKIGKQQSSIFAGIRPNLLFSGDYYYKTKLDDHSDNSKDFSRVYEFNPLQSDETEIPAKRFRNQVLIGASTGINQSLKMILSFSVGQSINYSQYSPYSSESNSGKSLLNSDIGISLAYLLKSAL